MPGKRKADPNIPGITYMVVDGTGAIHSRFMKFHKEPLYKFAVVRIPGCTLVGSCTLCSLQSEAEKALHVALHSRYDKYSAELAGDMGLIGKPMYPLARMEHVTWRVGK